MTTTKTHLRRRTFLRGALAGVPVALGVPILDAMLDDGGTALASGRPLPRRFGVFYWGGGVVLSHWVPKATGAEWALPPSLEPFGATLRPYLTVVSGANHPKCNPGHIPARGVALSSSHDPTPARTPNVFWGQNMPEPSVDALVAEAWRGQTLFDSIEVGICRKGLYKSNTSWKRGGRAYNRHEPSPQRLYDRLFAGEGAAATGGVLQVATALDRSMLDVVASEARDLEHRVGHADRARLEEHLEAVRAIERRLQQRERLDLGARCALPERPEARDYGDGGLREEKEAKTRVMADLVATALACDLTRVFSFEFSAGQSHTIFWEVDVMEEHHLVTHREVNGGPDMPKTIRFVMQCFATLAEALRSRREGDGNLLDRTLILGTSEHATAGKHDFVDHPFVLVGKAGGGIRAGVHHRVTDDKNHDAPEVLLSAVRAVGVPAPSLGQPDRRATRGIGAILAAAALALALPRAAAADASTPDDVVFEPAIEFANPDGQHLKLDLARPRQAPGPLPAVVCIHGGGFRAGARDAMDGTVRRLASRGYVAVTVDYRLAPKYQFPAAVLDVKAAVRWLRLNARRYGVDPARIGAYGQSAGAHLAQFLGVTADVRRFDGQDNPGPPSGVAAVVNFYGPADFPKQYPKSVDASKVLPLWLGGDLTTAMRRHVEASPLYWITPDAAPTLRVQGTKDPYLDMEQAVWLVDRLKASQVEAELLVIEGAGHGFQGEDAKRADAAMMAFLDRHLKRARE